MDIKVVPHIINHWSEEEERDIAITPCLYARKDTLHAVQSWSLMITWLGVSVGWQVMWID